VKAIKGGSKIGAGHFNFYHGAVNPFLILLSKVISGQNRNFLTENIFLIYSGRDPQINSRGDLPPGLTAIIIELKSIVVC
jgi:hypothetical protein